MKTVLEHLPIYWTSLAYIPTGTIDHIIKISYQFFWKSNVEDKSFAQTAWEKNVIPKQLGGWGFTINTYLENI